MGSLIPFKFICCVNPNINYQYIKIVLLKGLFSCKNVYLFTRCIFSQQDQNQTCITCICWQKHEKQLYLPSLPESNLSVQTFVPISLVKYLRPVARAMLTVFLLFAITRIYFIL